MVEKNINKTRKILVTVFEKNGEYEYNTHIPVEIEEDVDIPNFIDDYAKNWYGSPEMAEKKDFCKYYLNSDDIYVYATYKLITEEEFNILKKYL